MKISLDPGAYAPVRGHKEDAGIDIKRKRGLPDWYAR